MARYLTPVDICNRALQHVGAQRITALTDDTKSADACEFVYDKVRQAELRRNIWRFATKRAILRALTTTSMLLNPPVWTATFQYMLGHIVADTDGVLWQSRLDFNINHVIGADSAWAPYCGPLNVQLWDSTATYSPGEIVYTNFSTTAGVATIYIALTSNSDDPTVVPAYDSTVTYSRGQIVSYLGSKYISLINLSVGQTPASPHALWVAATTYALNDVVIDPNDGRIYTSTANANTGNAPSLTSTHWTAASSAPYVQPWLIWTAGNGALSWLYYGDGTSIELKTPDVLYPASTGPATSSSVRNIFVLPAAFLRKAPTDPKAGSASFIGAPSGPQYDDWVFESNLMISRDTGPVMMRFIADCTNVAEFDSMFCEGLAARIASEICEELTQSTDKLAAITTAYRLAIREARGANAVETGAVEPAQDDYLTCRY